eukprot:353839-Chlamydomonas_euryale.AAC.52
MALARVARLFACAFTCCASYAAAQLQWNRITLGLGSGTPCFSSDPLLEYAPAHNVMVLVGGCGSNV